MRTAPALLLYCLACTQPTTTQRTTAPAPEPIANSPTGLTPLERARIVEAIIIFRYNGFSNDPLLLDGCSVARIGGPDYRTLIRRHLRERVSEPATRWGSKPDYTGNARRLVLDSMIGAGDSASARVSYLAGNYTHYESYKLRSSSSRHDANWFATEMRVHGAMIVD